MSDFPPPISFLIDTSVDDCRSSVKLISDLTLLRAALGKAEELGHKSRAKVIQSRIRALGIQPSRLLGYARVSTHHQTLVPQEEALEAAGCREIYSDVASGAKAARPGLAELLKAARSGDVLVVWKLDRLGRSLKHLIETVNELGSRGIGFKSLQESIDTTSPAGKLLFHVMGALAEFERSIISERTKAGLDSARRKGRRGGRRQLLDNGKLESAAAMMAAGQSVAHVCKTLNVSRRTLKRHLA